MERQKAITEDEHEYAGLDGTQPARATRRTRCPTGHSVALGRESTRGPAGGTLLETCLRTAVTPMSAEPRIPLGYGKTHPSE